MTSKHYRWQTRWAVDLANASARHDSGLVVRFREAPDAPGAWDGETVDDPALIAQLLKQHGPHNLPAMLSRWLREAGQLYREALDARH